MWKKGRGKLGILEPLIGSWVANSSAPQGKVRCERTFQKVLSGKFIELVAKWEFADSAYEELALFGVGEDKNISFWSFTSDGKHSHGVVADVSDIHPKAVGFEAQMPAGLARTIYWPASDVGFYWAVESRTKKGWNRFVEHHYFPQYHRRRSGENR